MDSTQTLIHAFIASRVDYCIMPLSPDHQNPLPTSYNVCWMLQHVSSPVGLYTSLITICHDFCMTICTSSVFLCVSNTRYTSRCTAVCKVRRSSTWPTVALQSQTLLADATYTRPVDVTWRYHITDSVPLVVEPSLSQARRSGTLYLTVFETRRSAAPAAASGNDCMKTDFFICYSAHSARRDALWLRAI